MQCGDQEKLKEPRSHTNIKTSPLVVDHVPTTFVLLSTKFAEDSLRHFADQHFKFPPPSHSSLDQKMSWLIDGRTFAKKVKNPSYGTCRDHVSRGVHTECPSCGHGFEQSEVWPGFPSGVKFDPSDQEILEHLAAQVGISSAKPHPFISEFIPTINVEGGICYTHPEKLPGIRRDGGSTHFFHIPPKAYTTGSRKRRKVRTNEGDELRWHKTGKTRPVIENGKQLGCKKIMVLYTSNGKQAKPDKTNWVMHQYHLGIDEEEKEGELVVSKVLYQTQLRQTSKANDDDLEGTEFELQEGPRKHEDFELTEVELPKGSRKNEESFELTEIELRKASRNSNDFAAQRQAELLDGSGNNEDFEQTQVELADGSRNELPEISIASPNIDFIESSNDVVSLRLPITPNTLDISHESEVNALDIAQITVKLDKQDKKKRNHAQILSEFDEARNDDTINEKSSQEERSSLSDSQLFSGSLDAELLKLLCNENLKALGEGDAVNGLKNIIAEASSSQDRFSLDKIFLGTPPELLESLVMNSQGTSSEDWLEKLRLFGDSQRTDDFNLSEFLQNSQSQQ